MKQCLSPSHATGEGTEGEGAPTPYTLNKESGVRAIFTLV